ncbi:hypothetical protein PCCS19_53020 [Paenibacillus sp. CCS19]|nr:hypothetical protein PCCS19_53020 [Paenibacillus cellulosilyticus]
MAMAAVLTIIMVLSPIHVAGAEGTRTEAVMDQSASVAEQVSPIMALYAPPWVYDFKGKDPSVLVKNGITYMAQEQLASMLTDMAWDVDVQKGIVKISGPNHTLSWAKDSKYAIVNGIKRKLSGALLYKNGQFYMPLRDVITWAGGTVKAANDRELIVAYTPLSVIGGDKNRWYWVRRDNGIVYSAVGSEMPYNIGKSSVQGYQSVSLEVKQLTNDSTLLTVTHVHGEPMLADDIYKLIVYKGKIVRQSAAYYYGFHSASSMNETEGQIVMLNGNELQLVRPDGSLQGRYDLEKLTGYKNEPFTVPYVSSSDGIALVEPYRTSIMLLVDLRTAKVIELYKELLPETEQKMLAEMKPYMNDFDYQGDRLAFVKRDGDTFVFNHGTLPVGEKTVQLTYTLKR